MGVDVVGVVQSFFRTRELLSAINKTNPVLIPQIQHPSFPSHFCPISLCNICYKLISSIHVDRLKALLSKLVPPFQLAFVPGSQLQDNYIVAIKLFHSMKCKRGIARWAVIKGDTDKAFDRVEWGFFSCYFA